VNQRGSMRINVEHFTTGCANGVTRTVNIGGFIH